MDALPPERLQDLIREKLESYMDLGAYQEVIAREELLKEKLIAAGKRIQ